ncbi:MAG: sigma-54-dependent Fis family transcriptional regulator, partial [Rhodospirillaceae bacterium]|nr:sigma-54-dependent Fis family transcriptional regulator [Rhodospirillaceae bacterium]
MRLLIIGNLDGQVAAATQIAMKRGAKVAHAGSPEVALEHLRAGRGADMAMMEVDLDIKDFIGSLDQERISIPVVACGIETDATTAANAIRSGAKEYIPLPPDPDLIAAVLEAVTEENQSMIFQDPTFISVVGLADQVAGSEASILITGESGSGKELMARYVHDNSRRARKQFISINCAAIPENLLESELFGHEKGSFTGAIARRIGKFEEASGGTLLLDEISEMDTRLQAKLLRAVQEREIDRIGGTSPIKVDIRLIATSNRDLAEAVKQGTFREDLLFRLNVVNLRLPALRERLTDITLLANHFAKKYAEANGMPERPVAAETIALLETMPWPGNVRELENTIHRAVLLATGAE